MVVGSADTRGLPMDEMWALQVPGFRVAGGRSA